LKQAQDACIYVNVSAACLAVWWTTPEARRRRGAFLARATPSRADTTLTINRFKFVFHTCRQRCGCRSAATALVYRADTVRRNVGSWARENRRVGWLNADNAVRDTRHGNVARSARHDQAPARRSSRPVPGRRDALESDGGRTSRPRALISSRVGRISTGRTHCTPIQARVGGLLSEFQKRSRGRRHLTTRTAATSNDIARLNHPVISKMCAAIAARMRDFAGVRDEEDTKETREQRDEPVDDCARVRLNVGLHDLVAITAGHTLRMQPVVHRAGPHRRVGRPGGPLRYRRLRQFVFWCVRGRRVHRLRRRMRLWRPRRCVHGLYGRRVHGLRRRLRMRRHRRHVSGLLRRLRRRWEVDLPGRRVGGMRFPHGRAQVCGVGVYLAPSPILRRRHPIHLSAASSHAFEPCC
jgi:hypothetical protein